MSVQKIKPLGKRVLVKREEAKISKGGIYLPDTAQEKPKQGEVIAVGPGKMEEDGTVKPLSLRIGDKILFSSFSGTEVKSENDQENYLIMSEDDVLAVME